MKQESIPISDWNTWIISAAARMQDKCTFFHKLYEFLCHTGMV